MIVRHSPKAAGMCWSSERMRMTRVASMTRAMSHQSSGRMLPAEWYPSRNRVRNSAEIPVSEPEQASNVPDWRFGECRVPVENAAELPAAARFGSNNDVSPTEITVDEPWRIVELGDRGGTLLDSCMERVGERRSKTLTYGSPFESTQRIDQRVVNGDA